MGLTTWTLMSLLAAPGQAPGVVTQNQARLEIPINYDVSKKNDIRELLLFVSRNQGKSWEQYALATPEKDNFFTFTAPEDGVYWFNMMIVEKSGKQDPADISKAAPGLKILIDTKPPLVQVKPIEHVGDEYTVSWDIQEQNPNWSSFKVEYRIGSGEWNRVEAQATAFGTTRFRVTPNGAMQVRVQMTDTAGNPGMFTRDVTGSNAPAPIQTAARTEIAPLIPPIEEVRMAPAVPIGPSVIGESTRPAPNGGLVNFTGDASVPRTETQTGLLAESNSPRATAAPAGPLPPVQVINVAKFDLAYEIDKRGPSGLARAELWVTMDDGKTWSKWDQTDKTDAPLTVDFTKRNNTQVERLYGLKVVLISGANLSKGPPVNGDVPDMRVDVDLTPPKISIYEPIPDANNKDVMLLRWQATDKNMASEPITLEWGESVDGPWHPIVSSENPTFGATANGAKRIANAGQYAWKLPANFPNPRVHLRVTARDTAGNIAEAKTNQPILVDLHKPEARIQGIIGAASVSEKR